MLAHPRWPRVRGGAAARFATLAATIALATAACGARTFVVDGSCEEGLTACDGVCVDLDGDRANCGECGATCDGACEDGSCDDPPAALSCTPAQIDCGSSCVDPQAHPSHCGGCFQQCGDDQDCLGGACVDLGCTCDLCDVVELTGEASGSVSGSTASLSSQSSSQCSSTGAPDLTHRFRAPSAGSWTFDTRGSSFDTTLVARVDCQEMGCSDDVDGLTTSRLEVALAAGQEVLVTVDGYGTDDAGPYQLSWSPREVGCDPSLTECEGVCVDTRFDPSHCGGCFFPCEGNERCVDFRCQCTGPDCRGCDDAVCGVCSDIVILTARAPQVFEGSTAGHADERTPSCVGSSAPEVVHSFRAPFASLFGIDTEGSDFDTVLSLMDPVSCGELACNDDTFGIASYAEVLLDAGQEVLIVVDGYDVASGNYRLRVEAFE